MLNKKNPELFQIEHDEDFEGLCLKREVELGQILVVAIG